MTDPIHIPTIDRASHFKNGYIEIIPEIARQIVAMGEVEHSHPAIAEELIRLGERIETIRASTDTLIVEMGKRIDGIAKRVREHHDHAERIAALEAWKSFDDQACAAIERDAAAGEHHRVCHDCGKSVLWGRLGPKEYHDCKGGTAPAPVDAGKPAPRDGSCGGIRLLSADQPAGDDAAVEVLADCILSHFDGQPTADSCARTILAAIRRGEVPGIWRGALAENIASAQLVADLRAKLDCVEDALRRAGRGHRDRGITGETTAGAIASITDERDLLAARVAELERERDAADLRAKDIARHAEEMTAERDRLAAEVTDLRVKLEHATEEAARMREYAGSLEKGFSPNGDFVRAVVALTDSWYHEAHRLSNSCDGHRGTYEPDVLRRCASALLRAAGMEVRHGT